MISALPCDAPTAHELDLDALLTALLPELRRAAGRELARRPSDTLSATALVNELYLRFAASGRCGWRDRAHFLGVAAVAMRNILVDRARRRSAAKRGFGARVVTFDEQLVARGNDEASLLALHDALDRLAQLDARLARVVECRFFGGMSEEETAEALGVTTRTVRRDWVKARALLAHSLSDEPPRPRAAER